MNLSDQVNVIELAIKGFKEGTVEVSLFCKINDTVPEGFVESEVNDNNVRYEKIIDAENGVVTKRIFLTIKD